MLYLFKCNTDKSLSVISTGRKMSEVSTLTNQIDSLIVSLSENEKHSPGKQLLYNIFFLIIFSFFSRFWLWGRI